jgi:glycosyltransferase involved in cell wall biosynthesis
MSELAIVIPAYKFEFFEKALQSIAKQTCKNFSVYVGDDNSPYNLEEVCEKFSHIFRIKYTRFNYNIGAKNLVLQWRRCVELIEDEQWIWLFSDDDLMDNNCVEVFYDTMYRYYPGIEVYRFNTNVIDDNDRLITETNQSPEIDTSENMAYEILMWRRGNTMPDHIFSKNVYLKNNGFVYTEFAQAADWATSILFSKEKGICTMQNAKVQWRLGRFNISGNAAKNRAEMIAGHIRFLIWTLNHFNYLKIAEGDRYNKIRKACEFNLNHVISNHYRGVDIRNSIDILRFYYEFTGTYFLSFVRAARLIYYFKFKRLLSSK